MYNEAQAPADEDQLLDLLAKQLQAAREHRSHLLAVPQNEELHAPAGASTWQEKWREKETGKMRLKKEKAPDRPAKKACSHNREAEVARQQFKLLRAMTSHQTAVERMDVAEVAQMREKLSSTTAALAKAKHLTQEQQLRIRILESETAALRRRLEPLEEKARRDPSSPLEASRQEVDALRGLAVSSMNRLAAETKQRKLQSEVANQEMQTLKDTITDLTLKVQVLRQHIRNLDEERRDLEQQQVDRRQSSSERFTALAEQVQCLIDENSVVRAQWHAKLNGQAKELKSLRKQSDLRLKRLLRERSTNAKATRKLQDRVHSLTAALNGKSRGVGGRLQGSCVAGTAPT
eukprot:GGOE01049479.1.p1 GENE.GGOE01049479.1~~GGOE01049479.1.p1  ORF type:complete len:358 (+),score=107.60 GGOE01049479.1:33-1076(+)